VLFGAGSAGQNINGNASLKFKKCSQLILSARDEPLSVVAMCINNPHRSPFAIYRRDTAPTETGLAELFRYGFPTPHATDFASFALYTAMTK
jgi:hypothetical protein